MVSENFCTSFSHTIKRCTNLRAYTVFLPNVLVVTSLPTYHDLLLSCCFDSQSIGIFLSKYRKFVYCSYFHVVLQGGGKKDRQQALNSVNWFFFVSEDPEVLSFRNN